MLKTLLSLTLCVIISGVSNAQINVHVEDFTTTTYMDPALTTGDWNTALGVARLPAFQMELVAQVDTPGSVADVHVDGNRAYVADSSGGLRVYDVSDPETPVFLGSHATSGDATAVWAEGRLAYVVDLSATLSVLDVSGPVPALLNSISLSGICYDLAVQDDLMVTANRFAGVDVIDISNRHAPTVVTTVNTPNWALGVDLYGTRAYVADRSGSGLLVIDVSNPATASIIGSLVLPGDTWDVHVESGRAYVGDAGSGVQILSVQNTTPILIGSDTGNGSARSVDLDGNYLYVAGYGSVRCVDVTDPANPVQGPSFTTPGIASDVDAEGEHLYVADGADGGLVVLKIAGANNPGPAAFPVPISGEAVDMVIEGDLAYIATDQETILIYRLTDPENPTYVSSTSVSSFIENVTSLDVRGDRLVVVGWSLNNVNDVLGRVFDVRNPSSPQELASFNSGTYLSATSAAQCVVLGDRYAFVGAGTLRVWDLAAAGGPDEIASVAAAGDIVDMVVHGNRLFAATGTSGIAEFDISNVTAPAYVGSSSQHAGNVSASGMYLYSAGGPQIRVHDVVGLAYRGGGSRDVGEFAIAGRLLFAHIDDTDFAPSILTYDIRLRTDPLSLMSTGMTTAVNRLVHRGDDVIAVSDGLRRIQVFVRDVDPDKNEFWTVNLNPLNEPVRRCRVFTERNGVAANFVYVGMATPTGSGWITGNDWGDYANGTGTDLWWRLRVFSPSSPDEIEVYSVRLEWLYDFAVPATVTDVPDDQGGWVRIPIGRSALDFADVGSQVTTYTVYRNAELPSAGRSPSQASQELPVAIAQAARVGGVEYTEYDGRLYATADPAVAFPSGTWEVVTSFGALQQDGYQVAAPTLADDSDAEFFVVTHTVDPAVWHVSPVVTGQSHDNIAPGVPSGLTVDYRFGDNNLVTWNPSVENDFQYFRVYRGPTPDFVIDASLLVGSTVSPGWNDPDFGGDGVHYKVTQLDHAGNESLAATPVVVTSAGSPSRSRVVLHQNTPNPFNPVTRIDYSIPPGARTATLTVYDAAGRAVRTLLQGPASPGNGSVEWNGCDEGGSRVASGVYLYQLNVDGEQLARRMVLLK